MQTSSLSQSRLISRDRLSYGKTAHKSAHVWENEEKRELIHKKETHRVRWKSAEDYKELIVSCIRVDEQLLLSLSRSLSPDVDLSAHKMWNGVEEQHQMGTTFPAELLCRGVELYVCERARVSVFFCVYISRMDTRARCVDRETVIRTTMHMNNIYERNAGIILRKYNIDTFQRESKTTKKYLVTTRSLISTTKINFKKVFIKRKVSFVSRDKIRFWCNLSFGRSCYNPND